GFIEGMYTGAFNVSGNLERGVNTPETPIHNGVYELYYQGLYLGSLAQEVQLASAGWDPVAELYGRMGHHIKLGAIDGDRADNAVLSPIEARGLDDKYDDGLADYGEMMARDGNDATDCVDDSDVYELTNER